MQCKKMSIHSSQGNNKNKDKNIDKIPGSIQGSLLNILEYNSVMLSEYGLTIARQFRNIREAEEAKLKTAAKELDDLFEDE
jgi:hypothetical protein